ncbi:DNA-binding protein [Paenibacillus glycanilyticus]|uniref:DNA-binding protein n=1 Tax=Paenibacillus glycanilyticus TaxID=126569 RepID=A0ABQ6G714_9BACL|nr:DNA-binding protein [Paenibacillus glycanilyticus]GLX66751.1 hypothetical protein MU1_10950 [Paenibacillus glycanilyticus]
MKSSLNIIIGTLIIGASIVISSFVLRSGDNQSNATSTDGHPLMTVEETATYLHLSKEEVEYIITSENRTLETVGSFTGDMFPYITINDTIYVNRDALGKWLAEASNNRRDYVHGLISQ